MKVLVTGVAGFIGFHVAHRLLSQGLEVVGIDNINDYYDTDLKKARLSQLGIDHRNQQHSSLFPKFLFKKCDLTDTDELQSLFELQGFDVVVNLAAQPGVRYSLENPAAYVQSNIVGFANILENCRQYQIQHLVYASSSSVYGLSDEIPFREEQQVDKPISLYAASKKADELMAHTYSHLFGLRTSGLRFFTVYGPWGRPDMAMYLFTHAVQKGIPIRVFNQGQLWRDFTFIDDIVDGIMAIVLKQPRAEVDNYEIYNIGNSKAVKLESFIDAVERWMGKPAIKHYEEMQPGDVVRTWADVSKLQRLFDYQPKVDIDSGVKAYVEWYLSYYKD